MDDITIESVKQYLIEVFELEVQAADLKDKTYFVEKIEDLEEYNSVARKLNSLVGRRLSPLVTELEKDEDVLEMLRDQVFGKHYPCRIFKISEYEHSKYGRVWVAYRSGMGYGHPAGDLLGWANFIVKDENNFKIIREYIYSSYDSDGISFEWSAQPGGDNKLTFESLEGPISIERYQEPKDVDGGLKLYNDNI